MSKQKANLPAGKGDAGKKVRKVVKDKPMPIMAHLGEIRKRLVSIALVYLLLAVACFIVVEYFVEALLNLGDQLSFVYLSPGELVSGYFRLALIMALVLASPFILYQIWGFLRPALKAKEKRACLFGLCGGLIFFLLGAIFAYFVAIPFMLDFFARFGSLEISASISFEKYMNFLISTLVCFGLVFELPVLSFLLSQLGILKPDFLAKVRKYAILVIFIIAAIITPPDVVSQVMIALPMLLLYELSIWVSKAVCRRKEEKAKREEAGEDDDEDEDDEDEDDDDDDDSID